MASLPPCDLIAYIVQNAIKFYHTQSRKSKKELRYRRRMRSNLFFTLRPPWGHCSSWRLQDRFLVAIHVALARAEGSVGPLASFESRYLSSFLEEEICSWRSLQILVNLRKLSTREERLCFFTNAYNLMVMHSIAVNGPPTKTLYSALSNSSNANINNTIPTFFRFAWFSI